MDTSLLGRVFLSLIHIYWYDFWTGEAFEGGREQMQTNILDILPLYVKAGSILPLAEDVYKRQGVIHIFENYCKYSK